MSNEQANTLLAAVGILSIVALVISILAAIVGLVYAAGLVVSFMAGAEVMRLIYDARGYKSKQNTPN